MLRPRNDGEVRPTGTMIESGVPRTGWQPLDLLACLWQAQDGSGPHDSSGRTQP